MRWSGAHAGERWGSSQVARQAVHLPIHYPELPVRRLFAMSLVVTLPTVACAQAGHRGLAARDIESIVRLESIEDRRAFNVAALTRIAASPHPEVRRRAALTLARLFDFRGRAILRTMRDDPDTAVAATVVYATGQLLDTASVEWLDGLMKSASTPVGSATEAAVALGMIRTDDSHARLAAYLAAAPANARSAPVVAEALLSIGRFPQRGDPAPVARWAVSPDEDLRWRAAWALFRPRDPAAVPFLISLMKDSSATVRSWAARGLTGPRVDSSGTHAAAGAVQLLLDALNDADRRVVTEAVRSLGTFRDTITMRSIARRLDDSDPWIAVSAAEALGTRGGSARDALPRLAAATVATRPPAVRAAALTAIADIWLPGAIDPAMQMARDTSRTVRLAAAGALARLKLVGKEGLKPLLTDTDRDVRGVAWRASLELADTVPDLKVRRAARTTAFASTDPVIRAAAAQSMARWADTADGPTLLAAYARGLHDTAALAAGSAVQALGSLQRRMHIGASAFFKRFPSSPGNVQWGNAVRAFGAPALSAWGDGRPMKTRRTEADYKRIVDAYVVADYNGARKPQIVWETSRGNVTTELYAGDAPLATDYILSLARRGKLDGVLFTRVVANFVAQQDEAEVEGTLLPDEVNRHRLTRGNLSWGSTISPGRGPARAFDTGPAVYVFAMTPQPHNEGDFTSLGHIISGQDIVDHIELGDVVRHVKVVTPRGR